MTTIASSTPTAPTVSSRSTRRVVLLAFAVQAPQTVALAAATIATGASALMAQTFVGAADLAVQVFLIVGVRTSARSGRHASGRLRPRALLLVVVRSARDLRERLHCRDRRGAAPGVVSHVRLVIRRRIRRPCRERSARRCCVRIRTAGDAAKGPSATSLHRSVPPANDRAGHCDRADREFNRGRRRCVGAHRARAYASPWHCDSGHGRQRTDRDRARSWPRSPSRNRTARS